MREGEGQDRRRIKKNRKVGRRGGRRERGWEGEREGGGEERGEEGKRVGG